MYDRNSTSFVKVIDDTVRCLNMFPRKNFVWGPSWPWKGKFLPSRRLWSSHRCCLPSSGEYHTREVSSIHLLYCAAQKQRQQVFFFRTRRTRTGRRKRQLKDIEGGGGGRGVFWWQKKKSSPLNELVSIYRRRDSSCIHWLRYNMTRLFSKSILSQTVLSWR